MFRLFSLVGVAFLAAAAVALTSPPNNKAVRRKPQLAPEPAKDPRNVRAALSLKTRPLYYARFSVN
jgi:hypothetical protein